MREVAHEKTGGCVEIEYLMVKRNREGGGIKDQSVIGEGENEPL